jgi:hypothetical protein
MSNGVGSVKLCPMVVGRVAPEHTRIADPTSLGLSARKEHSEPLQLINFTWSGKGGTREFIGPSVSYWWVAVSFGKERMVKGKVVPVLN